MIVVPKIGLPYDVQVQGRNSLDPPELGTWIVTRLSRTPLLERAFPARFHEFGRFDGECTELTRHAGANDTLVTSALN